MSTRLSRKQKEYIRCANKRWNIKCGAVRSGKSYVDTAFVVPYRIRQVADKPVKVKDHSCDSIRYMVKTMHVVQKARKQAKA